MPSEKDQELDTSQSDSSERDKSEETGSKVDESGAEVKRGGTSHDQAGSRLQRERNRALDRADRLEDENKALREQQQQRPQAVTPQPPTDFDWADPGKSIRQMVAQGVAQSSVQTQKVLRSEAQTEKAREYMESQPGYNEEALLQVFKDHPELNDLADRNPMSAVKNAVLIWNLQRGNTDVFDNKRAAAGGIGPTPTPMRPKGQSELFGRIKKKAGEADEKDIGRTWEILQEAEDKGQNVKF